MYGGAAFLFSYPIQLYLFTGLSLPVTGSGETVRILLKPIYCCTLNYSLRSTGKYVLLFMVLPGIHRQEGPISAAAVNTAEPEERAVMGEQPIIQVDHLNKTFHTKEGQVNAANDISFDIYKGDIFGIIGLSGAGKSTLVRCLNLLERPDSGDVKVNGQSLIAMSAKQLRQQRRSIGMIFQHFNLLMQRNVLDNICFPMEIAGVSREKARARAMEMLETVGMSDKAKAYPAQLSGGQKQRVAIARVLANNPEIILCDEATSALDPQTTKSILDLLQKINRDFGITVVVITHEMSVVQQICNRVAVLDHGSLAEMGTVREIFDNPRTDAAKRLIIGAGARMVEEMKGHRIIRIVFGEQSSYEPVVSNVTLQFHTPVNILFADTKDLGGTAVGQMILQLPDDKELADKMIAFLRERKLKVEELKNYVG